MNRNCECRLSNVAKDYVSTFHNILDAMIQGMTNAELSDSISYNFIMQMIPHHRGAVEMSELALQYRICPELVPILNAIIRSQKQEIRQMQQLLRCMGC